MNRKFNERKISKCSDSKPKRISDLSLLLAHHIDRQKKRRILTQKKNDGGEFFLPLTVCSRLSSSNVPLMALRIQGRTPTRYGRLALVGCLAKILAKPHQQVLLSKPPKERCKVHKKNLKKGRGLGCWVQEDGFGFVHGTSQKYELVHVFLRWSEFSIKEKKK